MLAPLQFAFHTPELDAVPPISANGEWNGTQNGQAEPSHPTAT